MAHSGPVYLPPNGSTNKYVKLYVDWTAATENENIISGLSGEALATSMGKIAKWYTDFKTLVFTDLSISNGTAETGKAITALSYNTSTGVITATKGAFSLSNHTHSLTLDGGLQGGPVNLGSSSVTLNGYLRNYTNYYSSNGDATKPWYKVAEYTTVEANASRTITFLVTNNWYSGTSVTTTGRTGILQVSIFSNSNKQYSKCTIKWLVTGETIDPTRYVLTWTNQTDSCLFQLWFKQSYQYESTSFIVLRDGGLGSVSKFWTLSTNDGDATNGYAAIPSTVTGSAESVLPTLNVDGATGLYFNSNQRLYTNATSAFNWKLPAAEGTIALTDSAMYITRTDPSSSTTYTVLFASPNSSTHNGYLRDNADFNTIIKKGTASSIGWTGLSLGNDIAKDTEGAKYGLVRIYHSGSHYIQFTGERLNSMTIKTDDSSATDLNLSPYTDNKWDLGTSTYKWRNVYAGTFNGVATSADKLNTDAGGVIRPVYFSNGVPVACNAPASGAWWNTVSPVNSSGVLEIGRYIDFHCTSASTNNYDVRLDAGASNKSLIVQCANTTSGPWLTVQGVLPKLKFIQTTSGYEYNKDSCGITAYPGSYDAGLNLIMQSGGNTIIGSGEIANTFMTSLNDGDRSDINKYPYYWRDNSERTYLAADENAYIWTGGASWDSTKKYFLNLHCFIFSNSGNFALPVGGTIYYRYGTRDENGMVGSFVQSGLVSAATTTARTWTLPDATGTIALTSDIPNTVYVTANTPTSSTMFCIPFFEESDPASGNKSLKANNGLRGYSYNGGANAEGYGYLVLGNATKLSVANNKTGILRLYSAGDKYINIRPISGETAITANRTIGLPNASGTVALKEIAGGGTYIKSRDYAGIYANSNAATASSAFYTAAFIKTNTGGWSIGTLPSNDKLYFLWTTDADYTANNNSNYVTWTIDSDGLFTGTAAYANAGKHVLTDPNSEVHYGLTIHASAGTEENKYFRTNNGLRALTRIGTTSQRGYGFVVLGNATASGTDGNKYGGVRIYTTGTKYVQISGTNDNYLSFSSSTTTAGDGIIPVTTDIYDLGTSDNKWRNVYATNVYGTTGTFDSLASKTLTATTIENTAGNFFFKGNNLLGGINDWVGIQADAGNDKFQLVANGSKMMYRQNDTGGTNSTNWTVWRGLMTPAMVSGGGGITVTATTETLGSGDTALTYDAGIKIEHSNSVTAKTKFEPTYFKHDAYGHITETSYFVHKATGTGNTSGWVKIATMVHTMTYDNTPIMLTLSQRGNSITYRIHIQFNNGNTTDPNLGKFILSSDQAWEAITPRAYLIKSATSTWDLYIYKLDNYDSIAVMDFYVGGYFTNHMTWTWTDVQTSDSEITGGTEATKKVYSTNDHTHSAGDITSGTLPISRGGTGKTTALEAITNLGGPSIASAGTSIGASSSAPKDLNSSTYTTPGTYHSADSTASSYISNGPTTGSGYKLFVVKGYGSASRIWQIASGNSVGNIWFRFCENVDASTQTWSDWKRICYSDHTHSDYLGASKASTSYYGMTDPDGTDTHWIRTTTQGIIPYQSGNAGSGHQQLGTSTWYFSAAYIDTIYENGTSLANKYIPKAGATDISGSLETNSTSAGFIVPGSNGRKMTLMNGNLTLTIGTSSWSNGIIFYKTSTLGMIGAFGTSSTCDYYFMGKAYNNYSMRMENDDTGKMTLRGTLPQLKFQQTTTNKTRNDDNDGIIAHPSNTAGMNMTIQSSGNMIIGSGEYPSNFYSASKSDSTTYPDYWSDGGEEMYVGSDNNVIIHTNANTIANRKGFMFTTSGNLQLAEGGGIVFKYATSTVEHKLRSAATTTERTWTLPDATGTIALTSNIPAAYAGSTTAGGAATTVTITNTENTSEVPKAIPFHDDSTGGPYSLLTNNGLGYRTLNGTTSALGISRIVIGNATASGTAGNKYGVVRIYSRQTYYADIRTSTSYNGNRTFTLPNKNGTVAVTGAGTWQNVSSVTDSSAINTYDIKYRKGDASAVEIRGSIKFDTLQASYSLTTLPSEYRPDIDRVFPIMDPDSGGYKGRLRITSAGVTTLQFTAPNVLSTSVTYYFSGMFTV